MKYLIPILLFAASALAQTPQTFSVTATPVSLPGNYQTLAGINTGMTLTITQNFDFRNDDIVTTDKDLQFYGGGFNYRIPRLSKYLNNISPNLNGLRFSFYLTGTAGVDQVASGSHYAFLGGGGIDYALTSSGAWSLGGEVRYAKLPGYANNTAVVTFGPKWRFF